MGRLGLAWLVACGPSVGTGDGGGDGSADGTGRATETSTGSAGTYLPSTGLTAQTAEGSGTSAGSSGDASTGDVPDVDCTTTLLSDLPGVSIDIASPCALKLGQALSGVEAQYTVAIEDALPGVDSGDNCYPTPRGGILVHWQVSGDGFRHCHCDVGLCPDYVPMPTTLVPGETEGAFEWFAYDWLGPSDYDPPFGDPFVPGAYTITVQASGFWTDDEGNTDTPFSITATRPILLVE